MSVQTILIAESDSGQQGSIASLLKLHRINNPVVSFTDGVDVLDYLFGRGEFAERNLWEAPGLMVLDYDLPRLNALQILQTLRIDERNKRIPAVVLVDGEDQEESLRTMANTTCLRKPASFHRFVELVGSMGCPWKICLKSAGTI